jgi:CBS domain-containing protein
LLGQVLRVFARQRVHRLAVVDVSEGRRRLVGVITQSAVLRFVRKHMEMLAPVSDVSMSQFLAGTAGTGAAKRLKVRYREVDADIIPTRKETGRHTHASTDARRHAHANTSTRCTGITDTIGCSPHRHLLCHIFGSVELAPPPPP